MLPPAQAQTMPYRNGTSGIHRLARNQAGWARTWESRGANQSIAARDRPAAPPAPFPQYSARDKCNGREMSLRSGSRTTHLARAGTRLSLERTRNPRVLALAADQGRREG